MDILELQSLEDYYYQDNPKSKEVMLLTNDVDTVLANAECHQCNRADEVLKCGFLCGYPTAILERIIKVL